MNISLCFSFLSLLHTHIHIYKGGQRICRSSRSSGARGASRSQWSCWTQRAQGLQIHKIYSCCQGTTLTLTVAVYTLYRWTTRTGALILFAHYIAMINYECLFFLQGDTGLPGPQGPAGDLVTQLCWILCLFGCLFNISVCGKIKSSTKKNTCGTTQGPDGKEGSDGSHGLPVRCLADLSLHC